jgi:Right handed beta helix region
MFHRARPSCEPKGLRAVLPAIASIALLAFGSVPAAADTFKVTNTHDAGPGSLRRAISLGNAKRGPDRIPIAVSGTIQLRSALPRLDACLKIEGPGPAKLTVRGQADQGDQFDVFELARDHVVHVTGLSIENGGWAIDSGHRSDELTVSHSTLDGNGGGIRNAGSAVLTKSTLRDNQGSGIRSDSGDIRVQRSTVSGNESGGIVSNGGTVTVSRSSLSDNSVAGAISNLGGDVTVLQSTLSGNSPHGVYAGSGGPTSTELKSTIVADSDGQDCGGTVTSKGHNLADDESCGLTAQGDQPSTQPLLQPLDDYGGPTRTFALSPTSPAVDAGFADGASTDQRGRARIVNYPGVPKAPGGDNSDVGAFELRAGSGSPALPSNSKARRTTSAFSCDIAHAVFQASREL